MTSRYLVRNLRRIHLLTESFSCRHGVGSCWAAFLDWLLVQPSSRFSEIDNIKTNSGICDTASRTLWYDEKLNAAVQRWWCHPSTTFRDLLNHAAVLDSGILIQWGRRSFTSLFSSCGTADRGIVESLNNALERMVRFCFPSYEPGW